MDRRDTDTHLKEGLGW